MINYKMFKSNKTNNCQSCDQAANKNYGNRINNMKEIILTKNIENLGITNYNGESSKNKLLNYKIKAETYVGGHTKACSSC